MENLTAQEIAALDAASFAGGDFLENNVGQTDLARLTHDQWMQFVETLVGTYVDKMAASHAPFAVNRSEDDPFVANGASRPTGPITEEEIAAVEGPPRLYEPRSQDERNQIADNCLRGSNGHRETYAAEIRSCDLWGESGYPKSYWHCLATLPPPAPRGIKGQWKASEGDNQIGYRREWQWKWQVWN